MAAEKIRNANVKRAYFFIIIVPFVQKACKLQLFDVYVM